MMKNCPLRNIEELKLLIKRVLESITKEMFERFMNHFKKRWKLYIIHKGRKFDKQLLKKISSTRKNKRLKLKKLESMELEYATMKKFVLTKI